MDTIVQNPPSDVQKQQRDNEEGQKLFDQMSMSDQNPFENLDLSSQAIPAQQQSQQQENKSQEVMDFREMMKQSKKQKKKEKRKNKLKAAKHKQASKKQNINTNIVSEKNTKRIKKMVMDSQDEQIQQSKQQIKQKSSKKLKQRRNSQSQQNLSKASDESAEYSEEQNLSSQSDNNKGDEIEQQGAEIDKQGRSKRKRLGKKSRMQRILQKQGFDLKQLGNDGQANYELNQSVNDSDDSFSSIGKKKKSNKKVKRDKKEKKPQLSNEQFLSKLKQIGCEDQVQENDSQRYNYDSGIQQLTKLKPKKEAKNTIKVQNKLFGNLEMEIQHQINTQQNNELPQGEIPTQKLQLQFKPKTVASSRAGSFLSKVQAMKKHRGLEADIDQAEFDKMAKEKAKRSIYQLVSKIQNEIEENEEIDIEIKAPAIAKGKSADLINNTMFIVKNFTSKNMNNTSAQNLGLNESGQQITPLDKDSGQNGTQIKNVEKKINIEQSSNFTLGIKKKPISRSEFFKQIKQSINVRRSKYVSAQELKNSFKPSKLQQLQEIRQKRQERRKKQAMYELGQVQDDDAENVIRELQDEVARHERISKDDLRRLLRQQQGMEELDEYEEQDDKKKNKKNKDKGVDQKQNNDEENKIQKENTQKAARPAILAQANNNKNIEQKQSASQHEQKHADDMIDEYDDDQQLIKQNDQQQQQQQEQIDVQVEDDNGYENENDQQNDLSEQQQEGQNKKDDEQIQGQQLQGIKEQDDIKKTQMLKQLQQQGIIMPGVNNKRKNLSKIIDEEIDPLKYIIDGENNVQENNASLLNEQKQQQTPPLLSSKQETLEFKQFKKLRKIAVVIQEKKKKREQQLKRAKEFFEQQAQLGSDNQENDDNVKAINRKEDTEQEDGEQLDQQLEELIDNAVDINEEDQDLAFRKYMQDVKEKDREQLQRILRGDFRRHNQDMPQLQQMEEDEKNRFERMQKMMEWMRRRQDDEKGLYADDSEDEDDQKNFYYDYNGNRKRINHKQKVTAQHHEEQSQQQNQQQVQQKLRYFLMDTISPAKNHSFQSKPSQLLTQLPQMFKKTNKPFNKPFAKFDLGLNKQENHKKINESQEQKKNKNFAGNLFTLGSNKGQANGLTRPKMKKTTSHMSEQLNKNKVQKPMMGSIPQNKLNAIFSRFSKPTKK